MPYPGYLTCVMSEPQHVGSSDANLPWVTFNNLPAAVDHRGYLKGCIQVHSQGSCGWCTAHATTASLEALLCEADSQSQTSSYQRVSEPHLWWLGKEPWPFKDCKGGWYISSAFSTLGTNTDQGTLLVQGGLWPYSDDLVLMNSKKPTDAALQQQGQYGAPWNEIAVMPKKSVLSLKQALAAGHNVVYSVPVFEGTGWDFWDSDWGEIRAPMPEPPNLCKCDDCPDEEHCLSGYHAVLMVGYDDVDGGWFRFLNSWGSYWAGTGFGRISYAVISKYGQGGRYAKSATVIAKVDAGVPDGPVSDSGLVDAPVLDAGLPDEATTDSELPDARVPDAPAPDAAAVDLPEPADQGSPDNALCQTPQPLALYASPLVVNGTTVGATNQFGKSITCGTGLDFDGPQRYFRLGLQAGQSYTISLMPSGWDAAIYAFADATCDPGTIQSQCAATLSDSNGAGAAETIVITPSVTSERILAVDSFDPSGGGAFSLTVSWQGSTPPP
jgi:hypothetical protein